MKQNFWDTTLVKMRFDFGFQVGFSDQSHKLFGDLTVLEEYKGRNGPDIEFGGDIATLVDI